MSEPLPLPSNVLAIMDACLQNASDLIHSATLCHEHQHQTIAFHLAILALEEIGKAQLIVMRHFAEAHNDDTSRFDKYLTDHIKKLFWAIWGPTFGRQVINRDQIEEFRSLASHLHETRLRSLYVNPGSNETEVEGSVSEDQVRGALGLAQVRLEHARSAQYGPPAAVDSANIEWFLKATDDPLKRAHIFGPASMNKLAELGSTTGWIQWLRDSDEAEEAELRRITEQELNRAAPGESEELDPKWKLTIRVYADSHSIRPRALGSWSNFGNYINLRYVNKTEMLVDFVIPQKVQLRGLWWAGWTSTRRFMVALNIGTMGFFWWYLPKHIAKYYEELMDLDSLKHLTVESTPTLRIDWSGKSRGSSEPPISESLRRIPLSEELLRNAAVVWAALPYPNETDLHTPFDHYLTALALMAKADVFLRMEPSIAKEFYLSLQTGMRAFGDWHEGEEYTEALQKFLAQVYPDHDKCREAVQLFALVEKAPNENSDKITLSEAVAMKVYCDAYFNRVCRIRLAAKHELHDKSRS